MTTTTNVPSLALRSMTLPEAYEAFCELDDAWALHPDDASRRTTDLAWAALTQAGHDTGNTNVHALVTKAPMVLRELTDGKAIGDTVQDGVAEILHLHRNTLAAVTAAAAASIRADPRPCLARLGASVHARTSGGLNRHRPLVTDEIVLLRTDTALRCATGAPRYQRAAATVALVDAGLLASETGLVTGTDLMNAQDGIPDTVLAQGNADVEMRFITLDAHHGRILRPLLLEATPCGSITYYPQEEKPKPRSKSTACSASRTMARALERVGLGHGDVGPASPRRWRVRRKWMTDGPTAACDLAGADVLTTARIADATILEHAPEDEEYESSF